MKTFQPKANVVPRLSIDEPILSKRENGFFFFAKETQSLKILANGKDKDIEETSLKQRVSLK